MHLFIPGVIIRLIKVPMSLLLVGEAFFGKLNRQVQFLFQKVLRWQFGQVAGDSDAAVFQSQQFDVFLGFVGTQGQAEKVQEAGAIKLGAGDGDAFDFQRLEANSPARHACRFHRLSLRTGIVGHAGPHGDRHADSQPVAGPVVRRAEVN